MTAVTGVTGVAGSAGGIKSFHPLYVEFSEDWITMRDVYRGERIVKQNGVKYLPPTPGMILDGMNKVTEIGYQNYEAYKVRALFPDYTKEGVEALVGMMHTKEAVFELPPALEPLRERATLEHESLLDLLRRINTEQLITGRLGLLADIPEKPAPGQSPLPYVATYVAESIINWDDSLEADDHMALNMVVLNESGFQREDTFSWQQLEKYRVLMMGEPVENESSGVYSMGVFTDRVGGANLTFNAEGMMAPMYLGKTLDRIPFVIINTKDIVASPDDPPLLGLAKLCMAIYRGEADYRQNLFMQGQDTLVVIGGTRNPDGAEGEDDAIRTGAGSRIDVDMGGDAKYVGVQSAGLAEQRACLENDRKLAESKAGKLAQKTGDSESGEALQTRVAAMTASLTQIAKTGAKGLENLLRTIAEWVGADPKAVKVTPNMDFGDFEVMAKDFVDLMSARQLGLPLSRESLHAMLVERGLTKKTFEQEVETIQEEDATLPSPGSLQDEEQRLQIRNENMPPEPGAGAE